MFNLPTSRVFVAPPGANGNGTPNAADLARLAFLVEDYQEQASRYDHLRRWYRGEHFVPLTDRQASYLATDPHFPFALNYLRLPVDVLVERLTVVGFDGPEGIGGTDGLLARWWSDNRMDGLQGQVHRSVVVDGDTYLLVEWDNAAGRPVFSHELAWDGVSGVKLHYVGNRRREVEFASKRWTETRVRPDGRATETVIRLNIYTPTEVQRFVAGRGTWQPYDEPGRPWREAWPIGIIPIVHFRWKDDGGEWGESELEGLIPTQYAINKAALDEMEAADKTGAQVLTLTGAKWPEGATVSAGDVLSVEKGDASWGVIPPGDISQLRQRIDDYIVRMAQIAHIPLQYFQVTGQIASAATQAADDGQLVAKVRAESVALGNAWEDVMTLALRLNEYNGGRGLREGETLATRWAGFERVDPLAVEERRANIAAALVNAGMALPGVLALPALGYSEEEQAGLLRGDTAGEEGLEQ